MKCEKCNGRGYTIKAVITGKGLEVVKIWCENCYGTGQVKYEGDRTNWEGE